MTLQLDINTCSTGLKVVEKELNRAFIDRQEPIKMLIITLIANENICFVGTPGTAKTDMTNGLCKLITADYFSQTLNAYTTPDDLFGHYSVKEITDNDKQIMKWENYTGGAQIAFWDEAFKAVGPLMNSCLTVLNERTLDIGEGQKIKTNIKMIVGASNEYPADAGDDLAAFWDRWTCRMVINDFTRDSDFEHFWSEYGTGNIGNVDSDKAIPIEYVDYLRNQIWSVDSDALKSKILDIRAALIKVGIHVSARRWGKVKKMIHSAALFDGRDIAKPKDLLILSNLLWRNEAEKEKIDTILSESIGGDYHAANKLYSAAVEEMDKCKNAEFVKSNIGVFGAANTTICNFLNEAEKLDQEDATVQDTIKFLEQQSEWLQNAVQQTMRRRR